MKSASRNCLPNEGWRNTVRRSKVGWRVEWKSRDYSSAVTSKAIHDTADSEESPSCRVPGTSCCLEEVDLVDRVSLNCSRKNDEELEKKSTSHQNKGDETENWACEELACGIIARLDETNVRWPL